GPVPRTGDRRAAPRAPGRDARTTVDGGAASVGERPRSRAGALRPHAAAARRRDRAADGAPCEYAARRVWAKGRLAPALSCGGSRTRTSSPHRIANRRHARARLAAGGFAVAGDDAGGCAGVA